MRTKLNRLRATVVIAACAGVGLFAPPAGRAHGDGVEGPVVAAAKSALEQGGVTPVLKWVKKERETEIRDLFRKTQAVRKLSPEAKDLADQYFIETLVRIHRAGEDMPCAGLKPSGPEVEAAVSKADEVLISGVVKPLTQWLADAVAAGVRQRFARAHAAKENADSSAEAGREYVEAYVEFIRCVECVAQAVQPPTAGSKH